MTAEIRQSLAAAANTVAGLNIRPYFNQSTKAGDGMVRLERIEYPNPFGGICRWQVLVVLPADVATAEKYLETKVPEVVDALNTEAVVTAVTPQSLALDTGLLPVVVIDMHREEN